MKKNDKGDLENILRPGDYALFKALSDYMEKHDAELTRKLEDEHRKDGYFMLGAITTAFVITNMIIWLMSRG
jgi:hypothetical protein